MDGSALSWIKWRVAAAAVVLALVALSLPLLAGAAQAATGPRVDLRVLVVTNGGSSVEAIATQLDREGVPYTKVAANPAGRPAIDAAFLADAATQRAKFQAVVLPNQAGGGLVATEVAALTAYERLYGIRQVNAYDFPNTGMGLQAPTYTGPVDGGTMTVTAAGKSGPFSYLDGTLPLDNFDTAVAESYGYLSQPVSPQPAGQTFTPLLTGTVGTASGVLGGVFAKDNREELVLTTAYNSNMQWWNEVASGVVTWMTRGVHLGYQRNYFAVHVDDIFLPDSRWSATGNCTPGDNCAQPNVTTTDIRMTPADVTRLVNWQNANAFKLDMVFNGGGSDVYNESVNQPVGTPDPLWNAFKAVQGQFPWINHTLTHPFLGCIQIAPTLTAPVWSCATSATQTGRQDTEIPGTESGGVAWASQSFLQDQIVQNQAIGSANFTDFDPAELVTGEHSGLRTLPQQPQDNPYLGGVLAAAGVKVTASDNSREPEPRPAGPATVTVPRFPMNVFYNAGTYLDEVDEYNWIYTSRANGGGGICEDNPQTSTCITPLAAANNAQAQASYNSYILPLEVRSALSKITTNNPRPFYAHQSNLAEDGILYPVVKAILDGYRGVYADNTPIVRTDMTQQSQVLARQAAWKTASASTNGWIDSDGIHVSGSSAAPLTVPTGTTVTGATMEAYAGELSAWTSGTVNAVPTTPMAGYVGTTPPSAPVITSAMAKNAAVTLVWSAAASGSPITGHAVAVYQGTGTTPLRTVDLTGTGTTTDITGLTNGTSFTFTVVAKNAFGNSPASARSAAVTPSAIANAPTIGQATPGNASATVRWTAPAVTGGSAITGYTVKAYAGSATTPARTATASATASSTVVSGLTNGTAYTFTVAAVNAAGTSPDSGRSASVTPTAGTSADRLSGSQQLTSGQALTSPNGSYRLLAQADGNLVVYAADGRAIWSSGTAGNTGARLIMQTDGNAVLYTSTGRAAWSSSTSGNAGAQLVLQNDGNLVVYRANGTAAWSTGADRGATPPASVPTGSTMTGGQQLSGGQRITSSAGYFLVVQADGNVVTYTPTGRPLWSTGTAGATNARLVMQTDGNLVLYRSNGTVAWRSNTSGNPGSRLVIQNDGNLVLYRSNGTAAWSTGPDRRTG